jgi:hypothetical protein
MKATKVHEGKMAMVDMMRIIMVKEMTTMMMVMVKLMMVNFYLLI